MHFEHVHVFRVDSNPSVQQEGLAEVGTYHRQDGELHV